MTTIPAQQRLIVALDTPDEQAALQLADNLGDAVHFYKIGLELFAAGCGRQLVKQLKLRKKSVFADLKLFDVPATVQRATKQIADSGADFLTVHGDDAIMNAAANAKNNNLKILAVTVLTSLDDNDLRNMGFAKGASETALKRAKRAKQCGCDGAVSSGLEVRTLRQHTGGNFILVIPGVRPATHNKTDDQKRTATPKQIIQNGGDYLVVGRPVRDAPNPRKAALQIQDEIAAALNTSQTR